ncbi:hypothetical protein BC829DRAFT_284121 [Chytridium lagenaria]|nr:hypothetical protein BC829DRAFT_284121 [Chytridium lagenaria]
MRFPFFLFFFFVASWHSYLWFLITLPSSFLSFRYHDIVSVSSPLCSPPFFISVLSTSFSLFITFDLFSLKRFYDVFSPSFFFLLRLLLLFWGEMVGGCGCLTFFFWLLVLKPFWIGCLGSVIL